MVRKRYNFIGLKIEEKEELEMLRLNIKKYRDLDAENTNEDSHSQKSHESVRIFFIFFRMKMRFTKKSLNSILAKLRTDFLFLVVEFLLKFMVTLTKKKTSILELFPKQKIKYTESKLEFFNLFFFVIWIKKI